MSWWWWWCHVFRCKPDPGPQPPCDPVLEGVVSNPENCGRITDTNGAFRLGLTKLCHFLLINNLESFHFKRNITKIHALLFILILTWDNERLLLLNHCTLSLIFAPHRDCINVVDPLPFFQSCVFDMCRYQGLQQVLCDQLQAYTDACLSAGAPVHQWREPDFCRESISHILYNIA